MFICAFDLGASGGRAIVGEYLKGKISITEMHRFANEPVLMNGTLYWDTPRIFFEMKEGLKKIAAEGIKLSGIGIDTWGVDYGLLDSRGNLIGLPVHYRDARTNGYPDRSSVHKDEIYNRTGIQHLQFNSIYQLMAEYETRPDVLGAASDLLFMPDLFTFYFTGKKINEYTIASTSQMLCAATGEWDDALINKIADGNIRRLLQPLTQPCKVVGRLTDEVLSETGIKGPVDVIAVGSHDTASAVAGTPLLVGAPAAYLSCGTWSLLGAEFDRPVVTEKSLEKNFTNEGGLNGKIRFLKNINGLWLIQRLLKSYNDSTPKEKNLGFAELIAEVEKTERKHFRIAPNDASFINPADMRLAVNDFCVKNSQGEPKSIGESAAAVYNGLAHEYDSVLRDLEEFTGAPFENLHMVGGGVKDTFLCGLTAKATGKRVTAGPVEASALGNIVAQLIGLGAVADLREGREIISRSFDPIVYNAV